MKESFKKLITPSNIITISISIVVLAIVYSLYKNTYEQQIEDHRVEKDHYFRTSIHSPLEDKMNFEGLSYYPPDIKYKVKGTFEKFDMPVETNILSSDGKNLRYLKYGKVRFFLDSIPLQLTVYADPDSLHHPELFIPFSDKTSGEETYISGRYLDLPRPKTKEMEIDFNKAYHPYCVYSYRYSCPIPPLENYLNILLNAGERLSENTTK